jgi:hypothetical protein
MIDTSSPELSEYSLLLKASLRINSAIGNINIARKRISNQEVVQDVVKNIQPWFVSLS